MNATNTRTSSRCKNVIVTVTLLQILTAPLWCAEEVTKVVLENGKTAGVTIQQKDSKYVALLQPVLPASYHTIWSCEYHASVGLHLASSEGKDFEAKAAVTTDTPPIRVSTDPNIQNGSIVLQCANQHHNARTATIRVNFIPEVSLPRPVNHFDAQLASDVPKRVWLVNETMVLAASMVILALCILYWWSLKKLRRIHAARIELDGTPDRSALFHFLPGSTHTVTLRILAGKMPAGYKGFQPFWSKNIAAEPKALRGDKWLFILQLKPAAKGNGAEVLWFIARGLRRNLPELTFPIFVYWSIPSQEKTVQSAERDGLEKNDRRPPVLSGSPASDLRAEISLITKQLEERDRRFNQQVERLLAYIESVQHRPEDVYASLELIKKQILESLYSEVNRATGDSLGEVRDTVKKQMREEFDRQLLVVGKLIESLRVSGSKANIGV